MYYHEYTVIADPSVSRQHAYSLYQLLLQPQIPYSEYNYFEGINFCGNAFRKVFADLNFRGKAPFLQHACMQYLIRGTCLIR